VFSFFISVERNPYPSVVHKSGQHFTLRFKIRPLKYHIFVWGGGGERGGKKMNSEIDIKKSSAMMASMYRNDVAVLK
jgi:hypothetical protein